MAYALAAVCLVLAGGLVWSSVTAVRLALAGRGDERTIGALTRERDDLAETAAALALNVEQHQSALEGCQTERASMKWKEIQDGIAKVKTASEAVAMRRARQLPAKPSGVSDVPTATDAQAPTP